MAEKIFVIPGTDLEGQSYVLRNPKTMLPFSAEPQEVELDLFIRRRLVEGGLVKVASQKSEAPKPSKKES